MNDILHELNASIAPSESINDVFVFAKNMLEKFKFLHQEWESDLRTLELVSSLFDHLSIECVNGILDLKCVDGESCLHHELSKNETV